MGEVFMMGGTGGGVDVSDATTTTDKVLSGETFYSNENEGDSVLVGTMPNNGLLNPESLSAGDSYTIPKGYTDGGIITVKDLASQTSATATTSSILSGETAWVNGLLINGTMVNNGAMNYEISAGGVQEIPEGYHNGSGVITAASLSSQTSGTAVNSDIVSNKTAWVNGVKVTGSMVNNGAISGTITTSGGTYTIPAGYHNGSGKVTGPTFSASNYRAFGTCGRDTSSLSAGTTNTVTFTFSSALSFTPKYLCIMVGSITGSACSGNDVCVFYYNGTTYQYTNIGSSSYKGAVTSISNTSCKITFIIPSGWDAATISGNSYFIATSS